MQQRAKKAHTATEVVKMRLFRALIAGLLFALLCLCPARAAAAELPIVMYHHVCADPARAGDYIVTPAQLEGDFAYLAERGYTAIGIAELVAFADGGAPLPEKSVLITFDDGQESFLAYVLPLLEKYDMRAVLAVVGDYADEYTASGDHNVAYAYLTWPEIGQLARSGRVDIACHTQSMHNIKGGRQGCRIRPGESAEDYAAALAADLEAVESRIEEAAGARPLAFAYPYGLYCTEARALLEQRGYRVALTCDQRVNTLTGDPAELMDLGRFNRPAGAERAAFFARLGIS